VNSAWASDASRILADKFPARHHKNSFTRFTSRIRAMSLWDTVMIALAFGSILFCFWARIRATGDDG
jgi:hypothetical protein